MKRGNAKLHDIELELLVSENPQESAGRIQTMMCAMQPKELAYFMEHHSQAFLEAFEMIYSAHHDELKKMIEDAYQNPWAFRVIKEFLFKFQECPEFSYDIYNEWQKRRILLYEAQTSKEIEKEGIPLCSQIRTYTKASELIKMRQKLISIKGCTSVYHPERESCTTLFSYTPESCPGLLQVLEN